MSKNWPPPPKKGIDLVRRHDVYLQRPQRPRPPPAPPRPMLSDVRKNLMAPRDAADPSNQHWIRGDGGTHELLGQYLFSESNVRSLTSDHASMARVLHGMGGTSRQLPGPKGRKGPLGPWAQGPNGSIGQQGQTGSWPKRIPDTIDHRRRTDWRRMPTRQGGRVG